MCLVQSTAKTDTQTSLSFVLFATLPTLSGATSEYSVVECLWAENAICDLTYESCIRMFVAYFRTPQWKSTQTRKRRKMRKGEER
jgi:hypothetical protein